MIKCNLRLSFKLGRIIFFVIIFVKQNAVCVMLQKN